MAAAIVFLSAIGPVLLASAAIALALLWHGDGPVAIAPLVSLTALVALWPTVTGASVALLCRWICPGSWGRGTALAAALWGLLTMLSSPAALSAAMSVAREISLGRPLPADALVLLKELSLIGLLSVLVVMAAVLAFEVPLRAVISRSATDQGPYDGAARSLRGALTAVILLVGWVAVEDAALERLSAVLKMFGS